jgi:hypothetical protein
MTAEPYASARRVFWVVDNGSSHAGRAWIERLEGRWRNLRLIHLPIHASWLNQVELYFSILQRKALTPNDLGSLEELAERLLAFARRYREIARPFEWTCGRVDPERVLDRVDASQAAPRRRGRAPFGSRPEPSGGEQDAGRGPGDADPDGDGLQHTGAQEPPRTASQVEQRGAREPPVDRLGLGPGDRGAGEAGPLDRRVDRPHDLVEQLRVGIVLGDRLAESAERR